MLFSKEIQDEKKNFEPASPHQFQKCILDLNFRKSYNMFCSNGILFNHESPIKNLLLEKYQTVLILNKVL